jgi:cystathionine beta-lyase/cystathionine gamma-synthase
MRFSTKAIHAHIEPDPSTGAIMTPIYQTSTYVQEAPGKHKGYEYARTGNPTRTVLEGNLAALEEGRFGLAFSSGCAAINTVLNLLKSGDHVISCQDLYGGSYRLFTAVYDRYGVEFTFVDTTRPEQIEEAFRPQTKLVWIETPSNPLLTITDIQVAARIAHDHGALLAVDNTFASPYLQQPLLKGADLVVHSTTKYLGGHSDLVGGAIITNLEPLYEQLKFFQNAVGAVPGPMDCFLVLRGVKTLAIRMERHCYNGRRIAEFLKDHPMVHKVYYPGLKDHPNHDIAARQMRDFGGMVSFEPKGGREFAMRLIRSTKVFSLAESLGGVESLISHSATMTHGSIPQEISKRSGLGEGLIRLSVGIEDIDDLIQDLEHAFNVSS